MRLLSWFVLLLLAPTSCARLNRPDPTDTTVERGRGLAAAAASRPAAALRIVSFNVHQTEAWAITRALLRNPRLRRADVIFLQEIEHHGDEPDSRAAQVARALGFHHAYAPGYGLRGGGSHGVAILCRFALRDLEVLELARNDTVVNSARRVALVARTRVAGRNLALYNVHLDARINPSDRIRQLTPVVDHALKRPSDLVVLGGDLNTAPFRWVGHLLPIPSGEQHRRVEELMRRRGFAAPVVSGGPTSKWLSMRLDGLYTRGLDAVDYAVENGVRLSDHLPLWLDVRVPAS